MNDIIRRLRALGLHSQARTLAAGATLDVMADEADDMTYDALQDRRKLRVSKKAGVVELTRLIEGLDEVTNA